MNTITHVLDHVAVPNHDVQALTDELVEIGTHRQNLLPCEADLRNWIDRRAQEIKTQVEQTAYAREGRETPLPVLDPAVFTWRHLLKANGLPIPRLALVSTHTPEPSMVFCNDSGKASTGAREWMYSDVREAIRERVKDRLEVQLKFTFDGVIPANIRTLIHAETRNFDHIYLLVDAPRDKWAYTEKKKPFPERHPWLADPLVLGFAHNTYYLLGQFDPTPIEQYITAEFTTRKQLSA